MPEYERQRAWDEQGRVGIRVIIHVEVQRRLLGVGTHCWATRVGLRSPCAAACVMADRGWSLRQDQTSEKRHVSFLGSIERW